MIFMRIDEHILALLRSKNIPFTDFTHEPVYTSEQASRVRGVELKSGVKALCLKTGHGEFLMVLVRADKRADLKAISGKENSPVKLASPAEVLEHTGCEIGSVPPFGFPRPLKTYFDREILDNTEVNFNIGLHTRSLRMAAKDLLKVLDQPVLYDNR